ncbi:MAG: 2-octaprenylphenol hydroxylase [Steroidobacteraceae bacterium]|nr:2-octaprenylphenol hydroxylase [Steroidobacteraceae bacterium]
MTPDYDLAVVGGGAVGAAFAALAVREALYAAGRVVVIERERPAPFVPGEAYDLRVVALSRASTRILATAGAWDAIAAARVSPYERMRVWHESFAVDSGEALVFDAAELGEPNLGFIVESRLIQSALLASLEASGVTILAGAVEALSLAPALAAVDIGGRRVTARLVVGADGGRSRVRELAGMPVSSRDFEQQAIVANVMTARAHEDTAWQRFLGYGTLAFLPLANGQCSIVWSVGNERAAALRALDVPAFERELTQALDGALGEVRLASSRVAIPLIATRALHYVRERCALIGDAAHTVHPLAGQGVNLGFLDAATLAEELAGARAEGEDPGALRILRRYERRRRPENELMSRAMGGFNDWLALGRGPVAQVARRGLGIVNRMGPAKHFIARRALGIAGDLPAAARGVRPRESGRSSQRR